LIYKPLYFSLRYIYSVILYYLSNKELIDKYYYNNYIGRKDA